MEPESALAAAWEAWKQGRVEDAARAFALAAAGDSRRADAHSGLGVCLRRVRRTEAAVASHRRALALMPDNPGYLTNLGNALRELGHLGEAESHLRRAWRLAPDNRAFAYNLALVLRDLRRDDEAASMLEDLLAAEPGSPDYAWDLALVRLYQRDYERGFAAFEARFGLDRAQARSFSGERLAPGGTVSGKTIFVTAEQGFGDALQFARFVPLLAAQGARIILESMPELATLLATLPGVVTVVPKGAQPPPYDLWVPLMSLPHFLGTTWKTLPAAPYLKVPRASPPLRPPGTALSVGLCWAGKTVPRDRSWPLTKLAPLLSDPRVAVVSLQMGPRAADLEQTGFGALVHDAAPRLKTFADTAALLDRLDLVITIDTALAHLAGALGKRTWVLLRHVSDWRWLDEGEDCAWYPSLRLFRQTDPFDFEGPVARMSQELSSLLTRPG